MDMNHNNNINEAKYKVYISFDNSDSSISSFISHLRAAFNRHGIYELGEENDCLFDEQIRVLLVVFSSNYKFFVQENLVNHLNVNYLVVVPVLHGVTVSSVEQQIKELDDSLSSANHVHMFLRGLLDSDVLSRHVYNCEQSESKYMEEIATDVFEKLYPTEKIGIHELQKDIENLICKQPWGIRAIGIYGEPGIGKTTLAEAAFRQMSSGYDASCFIKEFHKEYSEKRLAPLSDEYFDEIPMEGFDQNPTDSKPSSRRKRVLIVLDDVQNAKEAESFLRGGGFGPGSLIIMTSREKQVLGECNIIETYKLQGLDQDGALKLYTRCVFGKDVTEQDTLDSSMKEIEYANGNPSTIRAHASKRKMELNVGDASSTGQESTGSVLENNTSMWIVPYTDGEVNITDHCRSSHNIDLGCLTRDIINATCKVITLAKARISIYKICFMCIVVPWVWSIMGHWEGLGFAEQTFIFVIFCGYLVALQII